MTVLYLERRTYMMPIKKMLLLLLALLMTLSVFTACNTAEPDSKETDTETATETETDSVTAEQETTTEEDTTPSSVLDGVKFNGEILHVFSWTPTNIVEHVEELTEESTLIDQAVFNRCDYAETRLNVKTQWEQYPMQPEYDPEFIETIDRENSNGGKYDLVVNVSKFAHALTTRGVYSNLNRYEYLDFDHPAWPASLIKDVTVGDKLYFATGDISTNLVFMTSVVFFNKDLVKDLTINEKIQAKWGEKDLYDLVTKGRWTLDKMLTLCEETYLDRGAPGKTVGDRFGLSTYGDLIDNFYYGGGYTTIVVEDGGFTVSPDFINPELVGKILSQVNEFFYDTPDGVFASGPSGAWDAFGNGEVLFSLAPASHAYQRHANNEALNYSVLPVPKHSESQETYACTQSFPYSMYGICSQSKYTKIAAAFMQALAEESYEVTRPALFDKLMKGRYAEDPEDAEMWEYAVAANVFDVGRIFSGAFGEQNLTVSLFKSRINSDNDNWSQALGTNVVSLTIYASQLAGEILALPD